MPEKCTFPRISGVMHGAEGVQHGRVGAGSGIYDEGGGLEGRGALDAAMCLEFTKMS